MNSLFNLMNNNLLNELKSNPVSFLMRRRLNLPPGFNGGPQEIVQHLVNTGQVSQEQVTNLMSKIQPWM